MFGLGIIRGLSITLRHFVMTYVDDIRKGKRRYHTPEGIAYRSNTEVTGMFTIQYPEEKLPVPEEFRYIPFLVYETSEDGMRKIRCTSCGICAKVCPPQCIWIVRTTDPDTGKPIPTPAEYYIDIDLCMSCGLCAEYCPFDAIKMDHDYEIASFDRMKHHVYNLEKLAKPLEYYASIRPVNYKAEEDARAAKAAAKQASQAA
ncbi:MAG: NADH:ubiquinone oxidoreductase chain I-like protein [Anaerolinea sp.]|nr:NADH:ubiquinone oxidoreductase chain I-like protein [Anaerolinea sp.]